jgi:hypothetical protein
MGREEWLPNQRFWHLVAGVRFDLNNEYEFTYQTAFSSYGSVAGEGDSYRQKLAV